MGVDGAEDEDGYDDNDDYSQEASDPLMRLVRSRYGVNRSPAEVRADGRSGPELSTCLLQVSLPVRGG